MRWCAKRKERQGCLFKKQVKSWAFVPRRRYLYLRMGVRRKSIAPCSPTLHSTGLKAPGCSGEDVTKKIIDW